MRQRFPVSFCIAFVMLFTWANAVLPAADRARNVVQQVFDAIHKEDLDKLRTLLRDKPDLLHHLGQPTFESLVTSASPAVFGVLLDLGLDVDSRDFGGRSPLHWAVMKSNPALVDFLIAHRATVDLADSAQATPLMYACSVGTVGLVRTLLDHGANPALCDNLGNSLFHFAAMARHDPAILQVLTDRHSDVNAANNAGLTPLMVACSEPPHAYFPQTQSPLVSILAKKETAAFLMANGADLTRFDNAQKNMLDYAIQSDNPDLTHRCIDAGADVNLKHAGLTPLDQALLQRCSPDVVGSLAKVGARAPYLDAASNNHLHMRVAYHYIGTSVALGSAVSTSLPASLQGNPPAPTSSACDPVVPILLQHGFPVDAVNNEGQTALHRACEGTNYDSVAVLLDFHADPNAATLTGLRPLDIAVAKRDIDITRLLLARGANPALTDASGEAPLHRLLTLSTPDDIRDRLLLPQAGKFNKYQQEVQVLYSAQRDVANDLTWAGFLLFLTGLIHAIRIHNRRQARLRSLPPAASASAGAPHPETPEPGHHEDLPAAVWKSANWKELAAGAEKARTLSATRRRLQNWLILPLCAFCLGLFLALFDPVWYATLTLPSLTTLFLPGFIATCTGLLTLFKPAWLRAILPPITLGAILGSIGIFGWQAWVLALGCRYLAMGSLLAGCALLQSTALVLIIRIYRIDRAIRSLNLPFDVNAVPPPPVEAEEIESHHGWDETHQKAL